MATVFWSWQSDLSPRETRTLIRDAIVAAIDLISVDFDEANRPEIDHDTKGVAGSPEIVATILSKIDAASVFVCDVTPITVTEAGKHIPNPNVAIELGYAKKSLSPDKVICVWNTAITNASVDDLTFDMRHRRGPLAFHLPIAGSTDELRKCRAALTTQLKEAISASLALAPLQRDDEPSWQPTSAASQTIWNDGQNSLVVNRGSDDPVSVSFGEEPRAFIRAIPSTYSRAANALQILEGHATHPTPLGRYASLSWGRTKGGFLAFRHIGTFEESGLTPTGTRWFSETGELWGVDSNVFTAHNGEAVFSWGYMIERWVDWLEHNLNVMTAVGGSPPFHIKLGLGGLDGTYWARNQNYGPKHVALESSALSTFRLESNDRNEIVGAVHAAFETVTNAYGLDPISRENFAKQLRSVCSKVC